MFTMLMALFGFCLFEACNLFVMSGLQPYLSECSWVSKSHNMLKHASLRMLRCVLMLEKLIGHMPSTNRTLRNFIIDPLPIKGVETKHILEMTLDNCKRTYRCADYLRYIMWICGREGW